MITSILLLCFVALGLGGLFFYLKGKDIDDEDPVGDKTDNNYFLWAVILWCLSLLFLILIYCLYDWIKLASKMIAATADFITDEK